MILTDKQILEVIKPTLPEDLYNRLNSNPEDLAIFCSEYSVVAYQQTKSLVLWLKEDCDNKTHSNFQRPRGRFCWECWKDLEIKVGVRNENIH